MTETGKVSPMSNAAPMVQIDAIQEADLQHHLHPMTNPQALQSEGAIVVERAEGIYLYTQEGFQLIDCISGLGCVNIGYGNERVCEAGYNAMRQLSYAHTFQHFSNPNAANLSQKMAEITPDNFQRFLFTSIGSDAVESAIKLTYLYWRQKGQPDKRIVISRDYAYHGNTVLATSLTGIPHYHEQFGLPLKDIVHHIPTPYWYKSDQQQSPEEFGLQTARELQKAIDELGADNIAAFIGEPLQMAGGMIFPPSTYWPEIERICRENDILLIADEVVTGFGKTGRMFAHETYGFNPDIMTLAKGLTSAYFPMGCVAVGKKVDAVLQSMNEPLELGFTNCGHPVGSAIALENIAVIEDEGLVGRVQNEIGPHLKRRLAEFEQYAFVGETDSMGVIGAIQFTDLEHAEKVSTAASNLGLIARPIESRMGFCLPMIITKEETDEIFDRLHHAFQSIG